VARAARRHAGRFDGGAAALAASGHEAVRTVATTVWSAGASTVMIALPA
jgi:hypothetical protein